MSIVINCVHIITSYQGYINKALYLCGLPSKNPSYLIMKKTIRQIIAEGHSTKYLTNTPQTVRIIQNKGSLRNSDSQEEPKETWLLSVMWYPRWDPETEKRILGKN